VHIRQGFACHLILLLLACTVLLFWSRAEAHTYLCVHKQTRDTRYPPDDAFGSSPDDDLIEIASPLSVASDDAAAVAAANPGGPVLAVLVGSDNVVWDGIGLGRSRGMALVVADSNNVVVQNAAVSGCVCCCSSSCDTPRYH
jgi:hypothetical protein